MGAKLVIWIDGCWRSLEELQEEGRLLKFAVLRNGHIKMLSRPPKLSSVTTGKRLLYRKIRHKKSSREKENIRNSNMSCEKENIGNEKKSGRNNKTLNKKENIGNNNTCEKENVGSEKESTINKKLTNEKQNNLNNNLTAEKENKKSANKFNVRNINVFDRKKNERKIEEVKKHIDAKNVYNAVKNVESSVESMSSSQSEELVIEIDDKDILLMRRFFLKTGVYKVDINRFDKDKLYRQATLYRFQPVVQVERLLRLHHQLTPSLRSSSRTSFQKKTASTAVKSSAKISNSTRRRSPVKFRKSSVPPGREYSSLEDHAIVSWLSASREREHAVNGNRVWRELQYHHPRLTGQERSWHSLRNRYLRYILPALGLLALPPAHAQRLRAAAATGEIKKSGRTRRASILREPPAARAAHSGHSGHSGHSARRAAPDDDSDGILHQKVLRPSIQPKKTSVLANKPQADKSKSQTGNAAQVRTRRWSSFRTTKNGSRSPSQRLEKGEVQTRRTRESLRKLKSPLLKSPEKSVAKKPKKTSQESESDKVKESNSVCELKSKALNSRSPLIRIQMEKPKNWSDHSGTDEGKPKKTAPNKSRDSEDNGETRERSRLRPRPQNLSDNSDDDDTYTPKSPLKKRRKLFNPFA